MARKYTSQKIQQKTHSGRNEEEATNSHSLTDVAPGKQAGQSDFGGVRRIPDARDDKGVGARAEQTEKPARTTKSAAAKAARGNAKNGGAARGKTETGAKRPNANVLGNLLEGIEEGVAHVSTQGAILYANPKFAELLGAKPGQMGEGRTSLRDFLAPACWEDLEVALRRAAQTTTEGSLSVEDPAHGIVRTIRLSMSPIHWKKVTTIKIAASETTEIVEKNRALQDSEASLHELSARILQLQDEERRRIARDLHDITGQELAVVIMALSELAKRADGPSAEVQQKITDAAGLVRKIEDEIRTLSYVLHPPLLDEFGLASALNWYAEGFTKRSGIQVEVESPSDLPRLTTEKEMALFRVVQEGLTNVLRHSGSRKARICVSFDAEFVLLSVEDEGRGIERGKLGRPRRATPDGGVGIAGMRERLQQLGGRLEVRPLPKGTEVAAIIPIGEAPPVEEPPSEAQILKMAEELGYKGGSGGANQPQPGGPQESKAQEGAKKRVLIADDHEVTREGIRSLLKEERDIEICGEAKDGLEVIIKARELDPDLVIMDVTMPRTGGWSAAYRIRNAGLRAKILFFTNHTNPELERMTRMGGFEGLVQKRDGARDLVRGVRAVLSGEKFYGAQAM